MVVKVGSSSLAAPGGGLLSEALARIVDQVAKSWKRGHPTVLVTSGAVAAGLPALGLSRRPADIAGLQVAAAVGQSRLMSSYTQEFASHEMVCGQVLVDKDVLSDRQQYLHARQALQAMLAARVVPVVNENDTVVVDELRLGDNDRLAAIVCHLVSADILVLLTDTDGLFDDDPSLLDSQLLAAVRHTDEILDRLRGRGALGSGGVATKVAAARIAAWSGIPTVVANAADPRVLEAVAAGEKVGTWVEGEAARLSARKSWIAFGQPAAGRLLIDAGALEALSGRGGSLLTVGVRSVEGNFESGDAVEILGPDRSLVAKGVTRWSSSELAAAAGTKSSREVVHRDDLVLLTRP